jgi:hypothetical protein
VAPSTTARLHTTATHAVPSTTETPEHNFAAVANIITPEVGRIRQKHVESYNTCNKAIQLCIKLDTHLRYDYDARSHKPQTKLQFLKFNFPACKQGGNKILGGGNWFYIPRTALRSVR